MSTKAIQCPKCHGVMVQGFIVDWAGAGGSRRISNWVEGAPEKSFWHGTSVPAEKCIPVVPSAILCVASLSRMRSRNLLRSNRAFRRKAKMANCILDNYSTLMIKICSTNKTFQNIR